MKNRNEGLDVLRCLSMMMVVLLHILLHGGALRGADFTAMSVTTAVLWILEMGAVCAVNCFGMLSGYFGVHSRVKAASVIRLWLQVVFYAVGIYFAWAVVCMNPAKAAGFMQGFMPVTNSMYWYYAAYAGLYLLMPMLNCLLLGATRVQLRKWLALLLAAVFAERLLTESDIFMLSGGYSVLWLAVMYLLGGYFRLHGEKSASFKAMQKNGFAVYGVLAIAFGLYWWARMSGRFDFLGGSVRWAQITAYDSPTAVLPALCLFAACSAWKPKGLLQKGAVFCAPAAFSVYLIHTHPVFWNEILMNRMMSWSQYPTYILLPLIAAAVLAIFMVCVIVERIRMKAFELLRINAACNALGERAERLVERLFRA